MEGYSGKVAVVTGAGSGIGAATALRFAQEGALVVLCGRRIEPLESVAAQIRDAGGREYHGGLVHLPADGPHGHGHDDSSGVSAAASAAAAWARWLSATSGDIVVRRSQFVRSGASSLIIGYS